MITIASDNDSARKFKFRSPTAKAITFFSVANIFVPLVVWYAASTVDNVPLFAVAIFVAYSAFAIWATWRCFVQWSPICVSGDGFSRIIFGNSAHSVLWRDVSECNLVRFRFNFDNTVRHKIVIKWGNNSVVIDDYMRRFDEFARLATQQAKACSIPTYYVDEVSRAAPVPVTRIERQS